MYGSVNDSCLQLLLATEASLLAKEKALEEVREKDLLQQRTALWTTGVANVLEPIGHSVVSVHAEFGDCLCSAAYHTNAYLHVVAQLEV